MNPRDTAVRSEAPSPNQSRSFKKKPLGIPSRLIRVGPLFCSFLRSLVSCLSTISHCRIERLFARRHRTKRTAVQKNADQVACEMRPTAGDEKQHVTEGQHERQGSEASHGDTAGL